MPRKKMSGGNIKAESAYDPFPRSGLVKQFEPFIRKSRRPIPRQTKAAGSGSCKNTIFRANLRAGGDLCISSITSLWAPRWHAPCR